MAQRAERTGVGKTIKAIAGWVAVVAIVIGLMLYLTGAFHHKIPAAAAREVGRPVGSTPLVAAQMIDLPRVESAVGTIRPVHEVQLASKILARAASVSVTAGQEVKAGAVLVKLDDADLTARLQQAQAALDGAVAARDQAQVEVERVRQLLKQNVATQIEADRYETTLKTAEARVLQAKQAVSEASTMLSYATIASPIDGKVVDKRINAGDMVTPGQIVLTLFDPTRMQLVASVRESLAYRLQVGQTVPVQIEALGHDTCAGSVSEIVPQAQAQSRTFDVKVTGPCQPGVYAGMFGRLLIPLDNEKVLTIPAAAVLHVGQLDLVDAVNSNGDRLQRRAVQLGRMLDDGKTVEVLSGLTEGEKVAAEVGRE